MLVVIVSFLSASDSYADVAYGPLTFSGYCLQNGPNESNVPNFYYEGPVSISINSSGIAIQSTSSFIGWDFFGFSTSTSYSGTEFFGGLAYQYAAGEASHQQGVESFHLTSEPYSTGLVSVSGNVLSTQAPQINFAQPGSQIGFSSNNAGTLVLWPLRPPTL